MSKLSAIPHLDNILPFQNRVSSSIPPPLQQEKRPNRIMVDEFHGHAWSFEIREGDAVYGLTEEFPDGPLDVLSEGEFLRVPYRRIPRIAIGSYKELKHFASSFHSNDDSIIGMWRGQTKLYTLNSMRSHEDLLKLYGTLDVVEPSLLPSAIRSSISVCDYLDAWVGLLDIFAEMRHRGMQKIYREETVTGMMRQWNNFRGMYCFRTWAMGVAQHYGLPSTGLDITPDIEVALFFALHDFKVTDSGHTSINRVPASYKPVIFVMGVFEGDLADDSKIGLPHLATPRAQAQKAHFFITAWGKCPNRAAERIIAVLDLENHETWEIPDIVDSLFPTIGGDMYSEFLKKAQSDYPEILDWVPLDRVYFR